MSQTFALVIGALALLYPALLLAAVFTKHRTFAAHSRLTLAGSALDAVLVLVIAHEFFPWFSVPVALWFVPVVAVSAGLAGAVWRWSSLPLVRPNRPARGQWIGAAVHLAIVVVLVVLILVL